jgi:uncharacterized protein
LDYKTIFLNEIPDEGLPLNADLDNEEFSLELENRRIVNGLTFKGLLQRFSNRYILSGELKSTWKLACDRCLKDIHLPVEKQILLHYVEKQPGHGFSGHTSTEPDDEPEELVRDSIDLFHALREQLILQIPMKALCSMDCKGLCSNCGQDLNDKDCGCDRQTVDPRLSKLKNLLKK